MSGKKHDFIARETPYGWVAECSCGTFAMGHFTTSSAAKRAYLNVLPSHLQDKNRKEGNLDDE